MSPRNKRLLAMAGFLLLAAVFAHKTWNDATRDLSELERKPVVGKFNRLESLLYGSLGRRGLIGLDLVFVSICLAAAVGSFPKRRQAKEMSKTVSPSPAAPQLGDRIRAACPCCRQVVGGVVEELPQGAVALERSVGFVCGACAAVICKECADQRIRPSWWDGWARRRCAVCDGRFAPNHTIEGP